MFTLSITKISPLYPNRAYIQFEVSGLETLRVPVPTLSFYVLRSEGQSALDPIELLNPQGTTEYFYVDTTPRLLSFFNKINYQVYTIFNGTKYYSEKTKPDRNLERNEYLRKRKMLYDEELVLRKYTGVRVAILRRRHTGERCTVCYDPNTRNVTRSHCATCFGTGFKNPFYAPFVTYAARLPFMKESDSISQDHTQELDYTKYQILDYPDVNPMDILVDLYSNDRYKVDRVETTEIRREKVHQELTVSLLARTSMEYKWDVGNDLLELPLTIEI